MKKRHLFWIIPLSIIFAVFLTVLLGHLISPVKVLPISSKNKAKNSVSEKEIKEDLKYLKYYFENMYAGYELMVEKGFDIDKVCDQIYVKISKEKGSLEKVNSSLFRKIIQEVLLKEINIVDMHLSIAGIGAPLKRLYFSDIYFKEKQGPQGKQYFVYKIQQDPFTEAMKKDLTILPLPEEVKIGMEYTGPEVNLRECILDSEKVYRYAVLTNKNPKYANISLEGTSITIPVLPSISLSSEKMQGYAETEDTLYISLRDFVFNSGSANYEELGKREFQSLCENARELSKGKKNLIIDLRNNGGGDPFRRNAVFANLMYNSSEITQDIVTSIAVVGEDNEKRILSSPLAHFYRRNFFYDMKKFFKSFEFKDYDVKYPFEIFEEIEYKNWKKINYSYAFGELFFPSRKWITEFNGEIKDLPEPDFKGDIYMLTNSYSASCSEYSMALAYEFEKFDGVQVHHIGENTCGAVSYVNPVSIVLPNSGFWMYIPTALNLDSKAFMHSKYHGEGEGWYPDYWVNSFQISELLQYLIDDPELKEMLVGIERGYL